MRGSGLPQQRAVHAALPGLYRAQEVRGINRKRHSKYLRTDRKVSMLLGVRLKDSIIASNRIDQQHRSRAVYWKAQS